MYDITKTTDSKQAVLQLSVYIQLFYVKKLVFSCYGPFKASADSFYVQPEQKGHPWIPHIHPTMFFDFFLHGEATGF